MRSTLYIKQLLLLSLTILLSASDVLAQETEMADVMRSNGKIYVVVAVLVVIFVGLFAYIIHTDRKLSKLEKEIEK